VKSNKRVKLARKSFSSNPSLEVPPRSLRANTLARFVCDHGRTFVKTILGFTLLVAVVGCSDSGGGSESRTVTDTLNGVVHVWSAGSPPEWIAESIVRIGSVDSGPTAFGRLRSIIADPRGNIYVADNLASEIRVFDSRGAHLRSIGRRGAGPGEFGDLYSLAWLGERLAAMDPSNARIAVLSTDGQWIEGLRHYPISGPASLVRFHPLDTVGFYTPVMGQNGQLPFVRITAAGASDTIPAPQPPGGVTSTGVTCRRPDGGIQGFVPPDAPRVIYAFAPPGGAVAVSWTETYRIATLNALGDTVRVLTREQPFVAYPDSLWEQALTPFREMHQNFPGTRCEPETPARPAARAALRYITFDEAANMWVESAHDVGYVWDVFDAQGRLIGRAPAPARAPRVPPFVRDRRLYQVEEDTLGIQHVAVYQLRANGSEPR
jgi:hypothetical protein